MKRNGEYKTACIIDLSCEGTAHPITNSKSQILQQIASKFSQFNPFHYHSDNGGLRFMGLSLPTNLLPLEYRGQDVHCYSTYIIYIDICSLIYTVLFKGIRSNSNLILFYICG